MILRCVLPYKRKFWWICSSTKVNSTNGRSWNWLVRAPGHTNPGKEQADKAQGREFNHTDSPLLHLTRSITRIGRISFSGWIWIFWDWVLVKRVFGKPVKPISDPRSRFLVVKFRVCVQFHKLHFWTRKKRAGSAKNDGKGGIHFGDAAHSARLVCLLYLRSASLL